MKSLHLIIKHLFSFIVLINHSLCAIILVSFTLPTLVTLKQSPCTTIILLLIQSASVSC